jgi:hypothetical protein
MELSWELEQLGRVAAPDIVLEGRRLLHRVTDLIRHDSGSVEAIVRGGQAHVVSLPGRLPLEDSSCTCHVAGARTPCAHVIAVRLRHFQLSHGLDDARTARWERRVEGLRALQSGWDTLAQAWLEATRHGDGSATWTVLRDVGSLHGAVRIARALEGRATAEQLSGFLRDLAADHGIDGTTPLGPPAVAHALDLVDEYCWRPAAGSPGAPTELLLAVAGSARRSATTPEEDWRIESVLTSAWRALVQLVLSGDADEGAVVGALLDAELDAPASPYPWSALLFSSLEAGASRVAREMDRQLRRRTPHGGWIAERDPRVRLRAEIGFASDGVHGLLPVLEEWPEAPYDEYLRRLPLSPMPTFRLDLLESAHRSGRVAWAPGWAYRPPCDLQRTLHQIHRGRNAERQRGEIAIGDLVVAQAQVGRVSDARRTLCEHARGDDDPSHRFEFGRIWVAAELGPGAAECAAEIFGPAVGDATLTELLAAIARIPEIYFDRELIGPDDGLCTVLLTAILLEDIPSEGHARNLDAPTWARSVLSWYPGSSDDLDAFASLPVTEFADEMEGVVLDRRLALRSLRIAGQIIDTSCPVRSLADLRELGEDDFFALLDQLPDAKPLTTALFALLLGAEPRVALEPVRRRFLRNALTGDVSGDSSELLDLAHSTEPRCADARAYQLAVVLAELNGRAPYSRPRA